MMYFKLGQDRQRPHSVMINTKYPIRGFREARDGDLSALDNVLAPFVHTSPINYYPDILDFEFYMIKGAIKDVFELFYPNMELKHCVLIDKPEKKYTQYFIPHLDLFDFELGIKFGSHIFRLKNARQIEVAVSLDVVEAILRRKPNGIMIEPFKLL